MLMMLTLIYNFVYSWYIHGTTSKNCSRMAVADGLGLYTLVSLRILEGQYGRIGYYRRFKRIQVSSLQPKLIIT